MAKNTNNTAAPSVDLAALYEEVAANVKDPSSKEFGKYLKFTDYRGDVVEVIKFLCEKHGHVPTAVVRQVLVAFLGKKIEALPEGGEKIFDHGGRIREEVTKTELKKRMTERLATSAKSSNAGPTITRSLCSPSNKNWLKKHHGITYQDGVWSVVVESESGDKTPAKHEEKSS